MKLRVSVAAILFPDARHSLSAMKETLEFLHGKVDMIEFYYEGRDEFSVARLLEHSGLASIFIAVIPLKEKGLSPCSTEENNRRAAVEEMKLCVDRARLFGSEGVMVCSGKSPSDPREIPRCMDAFVESMREVAGHISQTGEPIKLLLEPCDSAMDAKHLLGPTSLSVEAVERVRAFYPNFSLTIDTAHVAEEGENFSGAMALAQPYCNHVHFANCMVADPSDPLYGDKHVDFDYPGGAFSYSGLKDIFGDLEDMYGGSHLDIALEVLCRDADPFAHFETMMAQMPWLFGRRV